MDTFRVALIFKKPLSDPIVLEKSIVGYPLVLPVGALPSLNFWRVLAFVSDQHRPHFHAQFNRFHESTIEMKCQIGVKKADSLEYRAVFVTLKNHHYFGGNSVTIRNRFKSKKFRYGTLAFVFLRFSWGRSILFGLHRFRDCKTSNFWWPRNLVVDRLHYDCNA